MSLSCTQLNNCFLCEFSESDFKSGRALAIHTRNPPRYWQNLRVKRVDPIRNKSFYVKGRTDTEFNNTKMTDLTCVQILF